MIPLRLRCLLYIFDFQQSQITTFQNTGLKLIFVFVLKLFDAGPAAIRTIDEDG